MSKPFKVLKIEHIGIAVENIFEASNFFQLLGLDSSNVEKIKSEGVNVIKFCTKDKSHKIELLEGLDMSSPISKFIKNKGEGVHHIALEVDDISKAIDFLKQNNIKLVYDNVKSGANNKLINFIHPKSCPGILLEICQQK